MSQYRRMTRIPRHIEREVFFQMQRRRSRAQKDGTPYCLICDIALCNDHALFQHNRDLHGGPKEGQNLAGAMGELGGIEE